MSSVNSSSPLINMSLRPSVSLKIVFFSSHLSSQTRYSLLCSGPGRVWESFITMNVKPCQREIIARAGERERKKRCCVVENKMQDEMWQIAVGADSETNHQHCFYETSVTLVILTVSPPSGSHLTLVILKYGSQQYNQPLISA